VVDRGGGRSGVADIQRARLITAMALVTRERGVGATTIADVVARSGVSRRTFYEVFKDRDDCFLAAFDHAVAHAAQRVLPAWESSGEWSQRMRAALGALLEFLDDEPDLGALCVVDALGAGPAALVRRARVVRLMIGAVDAGRQAAPRGAKPTRFAAEGVVGAVLAVLHARLTGGDPLELDDARGRAARGGASGGHGGASGARGGAPAGRGDAGSHARSMTNLLSPLMAMIVLPYRGQAAAAREAARPAPRRRSSSPRIGDPLRELGIRLTYRTVCVLRAIAALARSGDAPSNREVGAAAGVADPGQISKLLARLENLGLIRNDSEGPYRGEPNAWRLTERGAEIERSLLR
jgi:AcrR family transcriptional regulator